MGRNGKEKKMEGECCRGKDMQHDKFCQSSSTTAAEFNYTVYYKI